jgi:hypothetical protein
MPLLTIRSDLKRGIPAAQQGKKMKSRRYLAPVFDSIPMQSSAGNT